MELFAYPCTLFASTMRWVNVMVIHSFNGKPKATASEISDAFGLPLNKDARTAAHDSD